MRLNKEFQLCSIAGKEFLIPVGTAVVNVGAMLDLNELSAFILNLLKEREYSKEELVERIFAEYDAEETMIQRDLDAFLEKAVEVGFIDM